MDLLCVRQRGIVLISSHMQLSACLGSFFTMLWGGTGQKECLVFCLAACIANLRCRRTKGAKAKAISQTLNLHQKPANGYP
jgi:hypothetical protein